VEQVLPGKGGGARREEEAQSMYTHINECKNDKIKERKKSTL
jgi:hypothetical protein